MEELSKYHIATVKDIIWNSILDKRKSITIQTFNALKKEYRDIIENTQKPKNKLIKFNKKKILPLTLPVKYEKTNDTFQAAPVPVNIKLSSKLLKKIKNDEKLVIEQGKKNLKSFLKDNDKTVSLNLTLYIEALEAYKGNNGIHYDGIYWKPRSSENKDLGDLNSFFLERQTIKSQFFYNKLKNYTFERESKFESKDSIQQFIGDFEGFDDFYENYLNARQSNDKVLIRISSVKLSLAKTLPINYLTEPAYDDGFNLHLSNNYIKTDTLKSFYTSEYVINNYKPRSCWLSLLCEVYKEPIEKYLKKTKISYESIHAIIGDGELKEKDNGYSFKQVIKFFEKFTLGLYVFDISFNIVVKHEPQRRNRHINPEYLYVIFHNGHIYHVNNDLHKLSHKLNMYVEKSVVQEPTDKYYLHNHKELENKAMIINNFDDLKDIIKNDDIKGDIHLVYQESCLSLWVDLLTKMKYEASIKMKDGKINFDSISLKNINDKNITISKYSEKGVTFDKTFDNNEMFHNYLDKKNQITSKLLNKNYISSYNEQVQGMLKTYYGNALIGSFENIYEEFEALEIDYNKYYTSILQSIEKIPVINEFDSFEDYKGEEIKDYNLYFVQKKDDLIEYPLHHYSLCYGMNIKDIVQKLNIISVLVPSKLKVNISKGLVKEIYDDSTLTNTMKKDIFNHTIGLFNRGTNKNTFSCVSNTREEALTLKNAYGGRIIPFKVGDMKKYINYVEMKKDIKNGFKLLSHMIYDIAHKTLFDLKRKVESYGIKVYKCNTDCLYIDEKNFELFYNENKDMFHESDIGKLKMKKKTINCISTIESKRFVNSYQRVNNDYRREFILNNEWDRDEINKIIDKSNRMIIKADIAGAGKTNAFVNYCKINNKEALFVCPWNSLCFSLKHDGNEALTLDKMIGLRFDGDNFKTMKSVDIEDYDIIIFDEIFLYDTYKLSCINDFMKKHSNKKFFSTGDENQNKPIETLNIETPKKYYNKIIGDMFYNSIILHDNKRCLLKEDQFKIKKITKSIRECKTKNEALDILKSNFKIIYDKKDIVNKRNVVALNRTAEWVNSLIHKPVEGQVYYEGLNLICRKSSRGKDYKLHVNYTYEILEIKDDIFKLTDNENEFNVERKVIDSCFRLSYARTCHSYQGLSETEPITIFDVNHFMVDIDWIYTAITRCTDLNNISIYMGKTLYDENIMELKKQIRKMIDGHFLADFNNGRLLKNDKFVDVFWTLEQLKKGNKCSECHKFLDISQPECFSIDRIDNNIGHYEFNCRVICRRCNCAKK